MSTAVGVTLVLLAALMVVITAYLVAWASAARTVVSAGVVLFLLSMMVAMLAGAFLYYLHPSDSSLVEGLWLASGVMSASVIPLFYLILADVQKGLAAKKGGYASPLTRRRAFALSVLSLALFNEFLMGWTFQLAYGGSAAPTAGQWTAALSYGVDSPWFLFPMAAEMALTTYLLRGHLPREVYSIFALEAAMMVFSPPALSLGGWVPLSLVVGSALMFAVFAIPMGRLYRGHPLGPSLGTYLVALLPIFGLMMVGLVVWIITGDGAPFAISVLLQMGVYFYAVIFSECFEPEKGSSGAARPASA